MLEPSAGLRELADAMRAALGAGSAVGVGGVAG
jgi:hypothetical protein